MESLFAIQELQDTHVPRPVCQKETSWLLQAESTLRFLKFEAGSGKFEIAC